MSVLILGTEHCLARIAAPRAWPTAPTAWRSWAAPSTTTRWAPRRTRASRGDDGPLTDARHPERPRRQLRQHARPDHPPDPRARVPRTWSLPAKWPDSPDKAGRWRGSLPPIAPCGHRATGQSPLYPAWDQPSGDRGRPGGARPGPSPDAVVCGNDEIAIGMLSAFARARDPGPARHRDHRLGQHHHTASSPPRP